MHGTDEGERTMETYNGSCHCGAVTFEFKSDLDAFMQCDCSLCRKKNAVMAAAHKDDVRILTGHDVLGQYRWNTRVARHYFCRICGIYTFHRRRSKPDEYGINAFCIEDVDISKIPIKQGQGSKLSVREKKPEAGASGGDT
jgi:hypothetical protein